MKSIILNIDRSALKTFLGLLVFALFFSACKKDESSGGPITITKIFLEDAASSVPDREVNFARLGQLIRIEGSGFTGLKRVYINGFSCYFNPVMATDKSMLVSLDRNIPIVEAEQDVRNTIRLVNDNYDVSYSIEIRAAAPTITNISNSMPLEGELITVYGEGLLEVNRVVFPGNIEVITGITSDIDGEFFTVTVPVGVSDDGGSLFIECANGGAYSPAYFNFINGIILNFDGAGQHGYWGTSSSMTQPEDLESVSTGIENISQGIYVPHRPTRLTSFAAATPRCSEVWTAGNGVDDWRGRLTPYIPATTPLDEVGFQFEIYVPEEWSESGYLKICMENAFNGGEWDRDCYNYVPWVVNGEIVPFQTTGWTTVTIPLNSFYFFADGDYTFEDVLAKREAATYQNFGIYFENLDFTLKNLTGVESDKEIEFPSAATSVKVYTDNWRIVSLTTPVYSDFPEK